jgi:GxxExxY protein
MKHEKPTGTVIGAAIEVHRDVGPGLLESTYEQCLAHELKLRGVSFKVQVPIPVQFKGTKLDCGYRADFLIEDILLVELKSVEQIAKIHEAQLLTYMKHAKVEVGLLINFNVTVLKQGLKRYLL